jgi:iron complex outermembrane receptor protein
MRTFASRVFLRLFYASPVFGVGVLFAQAPAPTSSNDLEQVVVTATKREAELQSVPFSVAATSEEDIRNSGSQSIVDLARNVASVSIADLGPGQSQIAVRGISSGQVIRDQPGVKEQVGVYLDESPISVALFTPDLELADLERFEVLRGPQGTLFGAGSEAGTLRYITRQPQLGELEGSAEMTLQSVSDGDMGGSIRGAINLPAGETVALRIVGYRNELPGFIDAIQPDGSIKEDVNDGDRTGGRVALLIQPTEALSITQRLVYQRLETNGYPRVDLYNILANPFTTTEPRVTIGDRQQYTQIREGLEDKFGLADFNVTYDFGPVALTSISSYIDRRVLVLRDATQLTGSVTFDVGGTDAEVRIDSPLYDRTKLGVFSQELRLSSSASEKFEWLVGGFFQDVNRDYGQQLPTEGYDAITTRLGGVTAADLNAPPDTAYFSFLQYGLQQWALFGEGTWYFTPQWALTGGLRYYNFDEERVLNFGGFFAEPTPPGGVPASVDSDGVSPRAILTFSPTEDIHLNAQFSRGFRLGGINDPINIPLCSPEDIAIFGGQSNWRDETAKNYELGAKMRFADRRVTLNIAAFYSDIKDLQATTTAGTCSSRIVFNVPESRSQGIEMELFVRPNSTWDFALAATYLEAELRSSVVSVTGTTTAVVGGLGEGNRLPTSAEFQGVASVGFTQPLSESRDLFVNFTVQHVGSSFSQFENQSPNFGLIADGGPPGSARLIPFGSPDPYSFAFDTELPSYEIGNLRVGLKQDRFEVAAFVNNLWDEEARLALDYERGRSARVGYLTNQPRTFGVTARWDF